MEGKVEHKFDMKPHNTNMEEYRKMCRERTNKSNMKNRQIQVCKKGRFSLFKKIFCSFLFGYIQCVWFSYDR